MQQAIKLLSKLSIYVAVFITIIIAYLSLIPSIKQPVNFTSIDKVEHLLAYFFLGIFWLIANKRLKFTSKIIIVLLCTSYGIILEVLQKELTTYRTFDVADMIANALGVILAVMVFNYFFEKKSFI